MKNQGRNIMQRGFICILQCLHHLNVCDCAVLSHCCNDFTEIKISRILHAAAAVIGETLHCLPYGNKQLGSQSLVKTTQPESYWASIWVTKKSTLIALSTVVDIKGQRSQAADMVGCRRKVHRNSSIERRVTSLSSIQP